MHLRVLVFITVDTEAVGLLQAIRPNDPSSIHIIYAKDMESGEKGAFILWTRMRLRDPENREHLVAEGTARWIPKQMVCSSLKTAKLGVFITVQVTIP